MGVGTLLGGLRVSELGLRVGVALRRANGRGGDEY